MTCPASPWCEGWYAGAQRIDSPNFGPRPAQAHIDLLVLHAISLPPGQYGGPEVAQFFTNQLPPDGHPYFVHLQGLAVSAHFFLRRDGALLQFVSCDDRAWHAGVSSYRGRPQCNDDSVGIELEGLDGDRFSAAQYTTLTTLCEAVRSAYPIAHVAGHEHIAPGRKQDPGPGFDWPRLRSDLGWARTFFPPD